MAPSTLLDLKEEYLRIGDPTEYMFVKRYLSSWMEWEKILEDEEYSPIIQNLRSELVAKLRSDALLRIIDAAKGETRDALSANKYLYEILEKDNKKNNVGRPSKDAIKQEASRIAEEQLIKEEAYQRLFNQKEI